MDGGELVLEVFVKTVAGKTCKVRVLTADTAAGLKGKLQSKEGIPHEEQRLIFAGKQLEGVRSLAFFGVQQHSTLQLLLRLPGGGPNCSKKCCAEATMPRVLHLPPEPPAKDPEFEFSAPGVGRALPLLDGVVGGCGVEAIVSFPGKYQNTWNDMVATVFLLKYLAQKIKLPEESVPPILSTACIFLPEGDENFGKHHPNDVDAAEIRAGRCFCHKLYGEEKVWGCKWFHVWRGKLEEVLDKGQRPVVVYKAGEVGEGDDASWERFPIPFSTEQRGLGGSQKGEVAYLKRRLAERGSIAGFEKRDVNRVSQNIESNAFVHFDVINGAAGGAALADAIEHCKEVQDALGTLSLGGAELGEAGGVVLARSLPRLCALQMLVLEGCSLGQEAGKAIASSLKHLPRLIGLNLANNADFGGEAAEALASNLEHLPELRGLFLGGNWIGDAAGEAIAANLQHCPKLMKLNLDSNCLGEKAGMALAANLQHLPELDFLDLADNRLGKAAGQALATSLHNLLKLSELYLDNNELGEEAGNALADDLRHAADLKLLRLDGNGLEEGTGVGLAASLEQLPWLEVLYLRGNPLGDRAKGLLRRKWGDRRVDGLRF